MQKMPAPLRFIPPMECLEVDRIPEGNLWQYELKLDGYRTLAIKEDRDVHLFSRNGASFNSKFPSVVQALERLRIKRFILDGEMVALDEHGRLLAQRQRRINKRLAMVSPLAAGVAFQLVLVIAICEDRSPVKPLSRSPHLNTLSGSLSHRSPGPDNCSCYHLPIPCRCSSFL